MEEVGERGHEESLDHDQQHHDHQDRDQKPEDDEEECCEDDKNHQPSRYCH